MRCALALIVLFFMPALAISKTIHVPPDYPTIQEAIDAAVGGDTVLVHAGTYVENIDFKGKAITVMSDKGPDITVIDGGAPVDPDYGSAATFVNGEGPDSVLQGFTLFNGKGTRIEKTFFSGGGIYGVSSSPTIQDNILKENIVNVYGGGIYFKNNASPVIIHNVFLKNQAGAGGGVSCENYCASTVTNNTFIDNKISTGSGGGFSCYNGCTPYIAYNHFQGNTMDLGGGWGGAIGGLFSTMTIVKNTVTENFGTIGGGIAFYDSSGTVTGNRIWSNSATVGGGISCQGTEVIILENIIAENSANNGGGIYCWGSSGTIMTNIISGNSVVAKKPYGRGGGAYLGDSFGQLTFMGNIVSGNWAELDGGGLHGEHRDTEIANNVIVFNVAGKLGGGISLSWFADPSITNNTIAMNSAQWGGGLGLDNVFYTPAEVSNTILWNNSALKGKEIYMGGDSYVSNLFISHSDVEGGLALVHIEPGSKLNWGPGMIDSDPWFVDSMKGDFHLTFNSPCRGSGSNLAPGIPEHDFEGDPRIAFGTADMGADEFFTHLYYTGDATPGGQIEIKFVGLPGTSPVGFCIGTGVLDPPLPSIWGDWYLQFPIIGPVDLGPITSPEGVLIIPARIPSTTPPPYSIPMQALIGNELTNLCALEIE